MSSLPRIPVFRLVPAAALVLAVGVTFALALALRFQVIEPRGSGLLCSGEAAPVWCPLRTAAVALARAGLFGLAAVATAGVAVLTGRRAWGGAALVTGAVALSLHNPEAGAVAFVAGLVVVTRPGGLRSLVGG